MKNNESKSMKSMDDILRDTKHNSKAQEVFLKLIAKQKLQANPFDKIRSEIWNPTDKIKQGVDSSDTN